MLATVRSGEPVPDAVVGLWKDGFVPRLELAAFDRAGSARLLAELLAGEVAGVTTQLVWQLTRGNALYVRELVRYGQAEGRLVAADGLWWWLGEPDVPPRLAELLGRRFDGMSPAALDALCAVVLAEPLSLGLLAQVAAEDAVEDLGRGLVEVDERGGEARVRLAPAARYRRAPARDAVAPPLGGGRRPPVRGGRSRLHLRSAAVGQSAQFAGHGRWARTSVPRYGSRPARYGGSPAAGSYRPTGDRLVRESGVASGSIAATLRIQLSLKVIGAGWPCAGSCCDRPATLAAARGCCPR